MSKVLAVTLSEALTQAYKNNPELNAERENIKVSEENLNISKGDYLPTLTLSGSSEREDEGSGRIQRQDQELTLDYPRGNSGVNLGP